MSSIVYFKDINNDFSYGYFKDFNIIIDKNTGCFNATKLCKSGNKQYRYWLGLERTKELINEFYNIYCTDPNSISYDIKPDKINKYSVSGIYLCKELFLDLASWISPEFYLKSNEIILNFFEIDFLKNLKEDKLDMIINQNKQIISQTNLTLINVDNIKNKFQTTFDELFIINTKLDKTNSNKILNSQSSSYYNPFSCLLNKFYNYFN